MKKVTASLLAASLVTLLMVGVVVAQGIGAQDLPGSGWWVSFNVQNVGSDQGTLAVNAYPGMGTTGLTEHSASYTIDQDSALTYHPGFGEDLSKNRIDFTTPLESGFIGSVVVSSDQPIVAIAEVGNNSSGSVGISGGYAKAMYQGIAGDVTDSTINFPVVKNHFAGQTTLFYVQAAGTDTSATITYKMNDGGVYSQTLSIDANKMVLFDPSNAGVPSSSCGSNSTTSPCFGGATVTTPGENIAGVAVEYKEGVSPAVIALATRGFIPSEAGAEIYVPVFKYDFAGASAGLQVQNTSTTSSADICANYKVYNTQAGATSNIGDEYRYCFTSVGPGQTKTFRYSVAGSLGGMSSHTAASVVVTGTQPIVAVINEAGTTGKAAYAAFSSGTAKVGAPLYKEEFGGMTTGLVIQNIGTTTTTVTVTFNNTSGSYSLDGKELGAGESWSVYKVNRAIYSGSKPAKGTKNAVVVTSSSEDIVAVAQEADIKSSNGVVDLRNYEAFNLTP